MMECCFVYVLENGRTLWLLYNILSDLSPLGKLLVNNVLKPAIWSDYKSSHKTPKYIYIYIICLTFENFSNISPAVSKNKTSPSSNPTHRFPLHSPSGGGFTAPPAPLAVASCTAFSRSPFSMAAINLGSGWWEEPSKGDRLGRGYRLGRGWFPMIARCFGCSMCRIW